MREQSLSLRTCGRAEFFGLVPGTTPAGQMGLGGILVYAQDEEHTQACAMFVRDPCTKHMTYGVHQFESKLERSNHELHSGEKCFVGRLADSHATGHN